jgi:hypothetical protein
MAARIVEHLRTTIGSTCGVEYRAAEKSISYADARAGRWGAISDERGGLAQNEKTLSTYYAAIDAGGFRSSVDTS